MTKEELWKACLGQLEITLSKANFSTWFKNTFIVDFSDGRVVVGVPNAFTKTWLQNKYHEAVFAALNNVTSNGVKEVLYDIQAIPQAPIKKSVDAAFVRKAGDKKTGLNPRYTLDHFVVGKYNELAFAAATAVAQKPGATYNPLFIYGGVGLGKTHLL